MGPVYLTTAVPPAPPRGKVVVYAKSDGVVYKKTPEGVEAAVGSSGTPGQLPGTTSNDNANAGNVGEYQISTLSYASRVTLTTATPVNITSLSLTAGDWDLTGFVNVEGNGPTTYTRGDITTTSSTSDGGEGYYCYGPTISATVADISCVVPMARFSLGSTTTVYLVANVGFPSGTNKAWGTLRARRMR